MTRIWPAAAARLCAGLLALAVAASAAHGATRVERADPDAAGPDVVDPETPGPAGAARAGSPPAEPSAADEAFRAALLASEREDLPMLLEKAQAIPHDYPLRDYVGYWELRLLLRALDEYEATPDAALEARVESFIATHRSQLTGDLLRRQWLLMLGRLGRWTEFDRHLPAWERRFDTRVFCYAGLANVARGRPVGEQAMHALRTDRDLGESCGSLARALHQNGTLDDDALRERQWQAMEERDWNSVQLLADLLAPGSEWAARAQSRPLDVIRALDAGSDPLPPAQAEALVIALVRHSAPKPHDTAARMDELARLLSPEALDFVWSQIAASAMRDMDPRAHAYARRAADARMTDLTRRWLVRAALREHDWPMVMQQISRLSSGDQADSTWTYWRARAMQAMGAQFGARALLERIAVRHDFYGELAAEALGRPIVAAPRTVAPPTADEMADVFRLPGVARALKFYELDMRYRGNREWNFAVRDLDERRLLAAATWACQRGLLERCISTAERTSGLHDMALRFVRPFEQELAPLAHERGLELAWIYGLIRQESRFTPDALSGAGARGLMQIMPATGRWIARRLGVSGFRTHHLLEPDTNLRFGTYYMKVVLEDLARSPLLASAAYNAGPRRARQWVASLPRDVEGALFVELIPFAQTRGYVKKVLLNTAYYGAILDGGPQSLTALLGVVPAGDPGGADIP